MFAFLCVRVDRSPGKVNENSISSRDDLRAGALPLSTQHDPAIDRVCAPGDHTRVVGRQKANQRGDFAGLDVASVASPMTPAPPVIKGVFPVKVMLNLH